MHSDLSLHNLQMGQSVQTLRVITEGRSIQKIVCSYCTAWVKLSKKQKKKKKKKKKKKRVKLIFF